MADDSLVIAGRAFSSRLITGTGKYPSFEVMRVLSSERIHLRGAGASLRRWGDSEAL